MTFYTQYQNDLTNRLIAPASRSQIDFLKSTDRLSKFEPISNYLSYPIIFIEIALLISLDYGNLGNSSKKVVFTAHVIAISIILISSTFNWLLSKSKDKSRKIITTLKNQQRIILIQQNQGNYLGNNPLRILLGIDDLGENFLENQQKDSKN